MPGTQQNLVEWLQQEPSRTIGEISQAFPEKSYAILILVLMLLPATPLPTGGITHVFEIITLIVTIQLFIGKKALWLPRRFKDIRLNRKTLLSLSHGIKRINRLVAKLEPFGNPYSAKLQNAAGLIMFFLVLGAFLAPPFTGLDTLPSLGAVLMALGLISENLLTIIVGILVGAAGVGIEIILGRLVFKLIW